MNLKLNSKGNENRIENGNQIQIEIKRLIKIVK